MIPVIRYNSLCYEDNVFDTYKVVGMVKRLTRRIVAPLRVGSIPTTHPIYLHIDVINCRGVAKW